jgi:hypothetical protein
MIVGLFLQLTAQLTPDTFAFLGKGEGLAFLVATLAVSAVSAWWKSDPLRDAGAAALTPPQAPVDTEAPKQVSAAATAVPTVNPAPAPAPMTAAEFDAKLAAIKAAAPAAEPPAAPAAVDVTTISDPAPVTLDAMPAFTAPEAPAAAPADAPVA